MSDNNISIERECGAKENNSMTGAVSHEQIREAVVWAYRMLLGREPENETVIALHVAHRKSIDDVRKAFLESPEFLSSSADRPPKQLHELIGRFLPAWEGNGEEGFLTDFLGTKTRCSFLPSSYAHLSGIVDGPPSLANSHLHSLSEWAGTLRSVVEAADNKFVVVELGAGWGPWLVSGARAAQKLGIENIVMAGVEGSAEHFAFMRQHLLDNGFNPEEHILIHGVVGAADGIARFPKLKVPSEEWGASADYADVPAEAEMEDVPSISLATLLGKLPPVDLIHCDIQGAEFEVLSAATHDLTERVRRIVVGTHSRRIEVDLMDLFSSAGWRLETDEPCKLRQADSGRCELAQDGVQVWQNPKFSTRFSAVA
jgi:FkbM family methyltransferase